MRTLIIGRTGNISTVAVRTLVDRGEHVTLCNRGRTQSVTVGDRWPFPTLARKQPVWRT